MKLKLLVDPSRGGAGGDIYNVENDDDIFQNEQILRFPTHRESLLAAALFATSLVAEKEKHFLRKNVSFCLASKDYCSKSRQTSHCMISQRYLQTKQDDEMCCKKKKFSHLPILFPANREKFCCSKKKYMVQILSNQLSAKPFHRFFLFIFFSPKLIFSKFFKLSGNLSYRIRTGFGALFQLSNDFEATVIVLEKN